MTTEVKIQVQDQTATVAGAWPGRSEAAVVLSIPGQGLCLPGTGLWRISGPRSIQRSAELPRTQGPLQQGHLAAPLFCFSFSSLHKSKRNGSKIGNGEKQERREDFLRAFRMSMEEVKRKGLGKQTIEWVLRFGQISRRLG